MALLLLDKDLSLTRFNRCWTPTFCGISGSYFINGAQSTDGSSLHISDSPCGAPLSTLWVSSTEVTFEHLFHLRVHSNGPEGTSLNTLITTDAILRGKMHYARFLISEDWLFSFHWTCLLARRRKAMPANHRYIETFFNSLDPNPRFNRIEHPCFGKGASHLTDPAIHA